MAAATQAESRAIATRSSNCIGSWMGHQQHHFFRSQNLHLRFRSPCLITTRKSNFSGGWTKHQYSRLRRLRHRHRCRCHHRCRPRLRPRPHLSRHPHRCRRRPGRRRQSSRRRHHPRRRPRPRRHLRRRRRHFMGRAMLVASTGSLRAVMLAWQAPMAYTKVLQELKETYRCLRCRASRSSKASAVAMPMLLWPAPVKTLAYPQRSKSGARMI